MDNSLDHSHDEDQEEAGSITLTWVLRKEVMKKGAEWEWLRIISTDVKCNDGFEISNSTAKDVVT
jgi:hypothetical protein